MEKLKRPSADKTRQKILNTARKQFLLHGFHGVSMQKLADLASINQNLIFHHFGNKKKLWSKVQENIVGLSASQFKPDVSSLKAFVRSLVQHYFSLYHNNPDLVTLMKWQLLDPVEQIEQSGLQEAIRYFQLKGQVRLDLNANVISLFIESNIKSLFLVNDEALSDLDLIVYQDLLIESLEKVLL